MLRSGTVAAAVIFLAATAHAQSAGDGFRIERFQLAIDPSGVLDVDSAEVSAHLVWNAGAWTGFAHDPLVAYSPDHTVAHAIVDGRLTTGLFGSIGLWNRVEVGLALDVADYQHGTEPTTAMDVPAGGLGDLRATIKVPLLDRSGIRFAFAPVLGVPLGGAGGYLRESGPTFMPQLAASTRRGSLRAAVNFGYRFRERLATRGLVVDDDLLARIGAGYPIDKRTELAGSASLALPVSGVNRNEIAIELLFGTTRHFGSIDGFAVAGVGLDNGFGTPDWRAVLGVRIERRPNLDFDGDGVPNSVDRCPEEPEDKDGFADEDGCPDPDNDGDGIADASDKCALEPEDKDGFEDTDGCPDPDNDHDGIADAQDRCPLEPEDKDGYHDDDGCPDPLATVAGTVIDPEQRPLAGAAVHVEALDAGTATDLVADKDGKFQTQIEGVAVKVTATVAGYQPNTAEPHGPGPIEIRLTRIVRQGQLEGHVQSFAGKPVAATIRVTGTATAETTADADGQFTLELGAGKYQVEIEAAGYVTQRRTVDVKLDGVTALNIDLRAK